MEFVSRTPQAGEVEADYSLLGGEHLERGRRLFTTGLWVLGVVLAYLAYTSNSHSLLNVVQGLGIVTLAVLPSLHWAKNGGSRFPVFEPIMLLCANAYGVPMLNSLEQLAAFEPSIITYAGWVVLVYQGMAIAVYTKTTGIPKRSPFWREAIITSQLEQLIVYGMFLSTIYIWMSSFTNWIPRELNSALRAVFYGISIICAFVSSQRWGRGEMRSQEKIVLMGNFIPQLFIMSTGLTLIAAITQIGIALLGYLSGSKRVPWAVIVAVFAVIAVLHTGKSGMRDKYWHGEQPGPSGVLQLPAFYGEWLQYGLAFESTENKTASRKLLERSSLMHILCLVATYSPERQDYLYGQTYKHVIPQLIPRLLWPDKPRSHIATYELSIYYGLQRAEDTENTTIAFGLLAEAYANFGILGAIALGAFWGFVIKKMQVWSTFSPMFSFAGLLMVLLTAWSFSAELTMAAWLSSFQQAALVVLGVPLVIRSMFGL